MATPKKSQPKKSAKKTVKRPAASGSTQQSTGMGRNAPKTTTRKKSAQAT